MRILFLSRWLPWPANNGSKLRIYNLLRGLSKEYEINLIIFDDQLSDSALAPEIKTICREVRTLYRRPFRPNSIRGRLGFLGLTPRSITDTYSHEMARTIRSTISEWKPDLVIASELDTAIYQQFFGDLPALFEEVEVGLVAGRYAKSKSTLEHVRNGLTWWKHRRYLANLSRKFQACTVVSENEKKLLMQINPETKIEVVPNCINFADYQEVQQLPEPDTLIFSGSFKYYPNYEAVSWFLGNVYSKIHAIRPNVHLVVTGDHANLPLPNACNVVLTGFVDDVKSTIARSWVSLAPILSGGGTRLKILESMALGVPVVSTTKGAEGLEVKNEKHILIADTPEEFSAAVLRLLSEPGLRERISADANQLIKEKYDWKVVFPRFIDLINTIT
jgi:polysaccharide biosynthesis protein PslH